MPNMLPDDKGTQASIDDQPSESPAGTTCNKSAATTNQEPTAAEVQHLLSNIDGRQVALGRLHTNECYDDDGFSAARCPHAGQSIETFNVSGALCIFDREYVVVVPEESWTGTKKSKALVMTDFRDPQEGEDSDADAVFIVEGQKMTLKKRRGEVTAFDGYAPELKYDDEDDEKGRKPQQTLVFDARTVEVHD